MERPAVENGDIEKDDVERPPGLLEVDRDLVTDIATLLESNMQGMVMNLVADLYPVDLAQLLSHLSAVEAETLFSWLPDDQAGLVLAELDDEFRARLLEGANAEKVTTLLGHLETDDAADVLADLPSEMAFQVLPRLENSADVRSLLGYDEESAGGIMGTEFVVVSSTWTSGEATEEVRRNADKVEDVYAVFAVDERGKLVGSVSLKNLLLTPADSLVSDIMDADLITVTPHIDQEEVARIMQRYDLVSLPVVDAQGTMLGRITIDDIVDVIREEAEEDIQRMSGMSGSEEPTDTVLRIIRGRLPWLLVGMAGAGLSGLVIGQFEGALEQAVVLAAFIPIVMAMAGNAGIQSSAIVVQGLASGEVWSTDVLRRIGKELSVAVLNGIVLALVLGGAVMLLPIESDRIPRLAVTASLSMLTTIVLATLIGTTVPLLLDRLKIDPALATGPFIMTSNDILGLAIYFLLATLIYL
ncbi:MAG: magnesium transporter [Rhodothermales bacterium]